MKYFLSAVACVCMLGFSAVAQHNEVPCATDIVQERLENTDPNYGQLLQEAQRLIEQQVQLNKQNEVSNKTSGIIYTIPVVVHVIYNDYTDNISRAQIEDALRVLNEDFRRQNADASSTRPIFQSVAADVEVEFALAKKDPNGNCSDGINRIQSNLAIDASDNVKSLSMWPRDMYMNIWTVRNIDVNTGTPGTVLGYAYRPTPNQSGVRDGIVIRHDHMGTIGTGFGISKGRTLTHEVGHYLGLQHPFTGGCAINGDGVADTPPVAQASFGCPLGANTCSTDNPDLPDMIENYMDYADDNCTNLFTQGQTNIMRAVLTTANLRANLKSSANLTNTGITNPPACQPTALFESDVTVVCPGDMVSFTDQTENGDPDNYVWTFAGGTPSTSTQPNPTITYNVAGVYDVTLTVSNAAGSDTKTVSRQIVVKDDNPNFYPNWSQSFEAGIIPQPEVSIINSGDGINFELFTGAGSDGNNCLKLNNFNVTIDEEVDAIVSPPITTIFTKDLDLAFDVAFVQKQASNDDELRVLASTDCGETWLLRRFYRGASLITGNMNANTPFVPASAADWRTLTVNFNSYAGPDPLLIKIEFEGGEGNNIYLDNFRFTGTIGAKEQLIFETFDVYPNPSNGTFQLSLATAGTKEIDLSILTVSGQVVHREQLKIQGAKTLDYKLNLPAGVYFLKAVSEEGTELKKLIID
jgi:PKD repeat protein